MRNPIDHPRYTFFREMPKKARVTAGLTQEEVADALGKPQNHVSKIERSERRVDYTEFLELADVLGIDVGDFNKRYKAALKKAKF